MNKMKKEIDEINLELNKFPRDKIVVYTYGAWDLLHPGHILFLQKAKKLGDVLITGVISDNAISKLKGKNRPVQKQKDRLFIVDSLKCVDFTIFQQEYDPSYILNHLTVINILTKGDDWDYIPGKEAIESLGGKLIKLGYSKGYSTSHLVSKISGKTVKKKQKEY